MSSRTQALPQLSVRLDREEAVKKICRDGKVGRSFKQTRACWKDDLQPMTNLASASDLARSKRVNYHPQFPPQQLSYICSSRTILAALLIRPYSAFASKQAL
jgi:hypothetical protein